MEKVAQIIRKRLRGVVVSANSKDTIKVRVEEKYPDPLYKKIIKYHKQFLVHCTKEDVVVGDKVIIEEGKPVSKNKKFYLVKKLA